MILAPENFQETEYETPRKYWESRGVIVQTASSKLFSVGHQGLKVAHEFLLSEVKADTFAGLFFVGGGGSLDYKENKDARRLCNKFVQKGRVVGAICAAPRLLLHWGILKNKKCTGWNGDGEFPYEAGLGQAHYLPEPVVVDGKIVTADGPSSAQKCAEEYLHLL